MINEPYIFCKNTSFKRASHKMHFKNIGLEFSDKTYLSKPYHYSELVNYGVCANEVKCKQ